MLTNNTTARSEKAAISNRLLTAFLYTKGTKGTKITKDTANHCTC